MPALVAGVHDHAVRTARRIELAMRSLFLDNASLLMKVLGDSAAKGSHTNS